MQNLDSTVIVTALPEMAATFGVGAVDVGLGITAYMLAMAAFIPISGWLADRLGARDVFAAAIAVFTLASVLCALSGGLWAFVGARVLQGFGAALMMPVGRLIVLRSTRKADMLRAIATITWPGLVAPVIGPPLGGLITAYASWPWIFLLNVPLGLVGLGLVAALVPNERAAAKAPFDPIGFVLASSALVALLYGLEAIGRPGHGWSEIVLALTAGGALATLAIRHLRRHAHPLVDLSPFSVPTFAITSLAAGTLLRTAISATPFLLPLLFQVGFGWDPVRSGLLLLVYFVGNLGMKLVTTPIIRRFGFRRVLIVNGLLVGASIQGLALLTPDTPMALIMALLLLGGLFRSMEFTGLGTLAFADVSAAQRGPASTLASMTQQIAACLGVALGSLLLSTSQAWHGTAALTVADFKLAFLIVGGLALASACRFLTLDAEAGDEVSGHRLPRAAG